ncbi:hypothetical protein BI364_01820 [Acidihalobacter yilgarnensis]|uniref:BolA family transcriptional regulator n=1 Tax=Acidihalobacter yilgarnensis TaxID=2819280 RepID=A0A1D8IKJ7_9GAMM|nr:BolA family protein [Acidihalobacter yilgarnensis]AOU96911.1 hypothetical protein BI364_01820 [Acidihalobacter yilgarnensis]
MIPENVKTLIEQGIPGCQVTVTGDGSKFEAVVVSEAFEGMSPVKEHQLVFATVGEHIASGAIHALTIKAYTPKEWTDRNA